MADDTTNALRWAEKYLSNLQAGDHAPSDEVMAVLWAGLEALATAQPEAKGEGVPLLHRLSMVTNGGTLHVIGDFADKAMAEWVADDLLPSDPQWVKYVIHTMLDTRQAQGGGEDS